MLSFFLNSLSFFRGAWRIRTAVDGFADRCLSRSSTAPQRNAPIVFLNAGAKLVINFDTAKFLGRFLCLSFAFFSSVSLFLRFQGATCASIAGIGSLSEGVVHPPASIAAGRCDGQEGYRCLHHP